MRRLLHLASWLYPAAWRARYSEEFDALLDEIRPSWRDLLDIFRGAILMQLSTSAVFLKLGAVTAIIGAIAAGAGSFALPKRYVSSAVMRITPVKADTAGQPRILASQRLMTMQQQILSRRSLAEMIQRPSLDLYRGERTRYPLEDIIQDMRQHDIRIQALEAPEGSKDAGGEAFRISFEYPDRVTAQAVVRQLVSAFVEENVLTPRREIEQLRSMRGAADPVRNSSDQLPALATNIEVMDPASLPDKPIQPNRFGIVLIGLGAGFALGLLLAFLRRQPLRWTLWMATGAIIGFAATLAIAIYLDFDPTPFAGLGVAAGMSLAAFLQRDRAAWKPVPYVKSALATGVLGAIIAGFASFAIAERYVSTAVMRIYPQIAFRIPGADTDGRAAERRFQLEREVLSRSSLSEMIQRPSLDLYRSERQRRPMEEIVRNMRDHAIRIRQVKPNSAFTISFEYPDRFKAQAVVREMVSQFTRKNISIERDLGRSTEPGAIVVEVIDPASNPQLPSSPNRYQIAALGFAAGIPLGLLIAYLRRRPPGQASAMLRFATATGAAGALLATAISFAIPSRYVSTAVLRVHPAARSGDRVQQLMMEVLSRQNLSDELRRQVRIQTLDVDSHGKTTVFAISYESTDAGKAHSTVQSLVSKFVEPNAPYNPPGTDPTNLEVLDAASIPNGPSFPPRLPIAFAGLIVGILLGPSAMVVRRRSP